MFSLCLFGKLKTSKFPFEISWPLASITASFPGPVARLLWSLRLLRGRAQVVARFDRKFMALNQSVTHAAGKAGRVVLRRRAAPVDRIQWAAPALCVEMGFTQTFHGKLLWIKLWPMHAGLVAQCHGRVVDRIQWAGLALCFEMCFTQTFQRKLNETWKAKSEIFNIKNYGFESKCAWEISLLAWRV